MSVHQLAPQQKLRRLELVITRRLDGLLQGQHLGLLPGPGSEPAGSREYRPGEDEVRRMDWAVTARTTVPHVRTVDADRELTTWVLVDGTASMDFGTADQEKRDLAVSAVAAVGFLTAGHGNRIGGFVAGRDRLRRYPARTGRIHLLGMLRSLVDLPRQPEGPAPELKDAIESMARLAARRGLVVIVSDFLDDGESADWVQPLRRLAARHQVLAVEVLDPRELELPDVGLLTLVDPETGRKREVATTRKVRERYAAAAEEQRLATAAAIRRAGAAHLRLRTDRDWVLDLVRHVYAQRRLARAAHRPGGAA
ncbi:DUF58 domain-containing protein [Virgisporangium aurantiacum]|uniref:DUF58 domain-containing protein n=1 Tax=Virgisporangium aurantiacum TaxID=175570 RepID=A0A8J4DWJ4_9ACTN|nr:DUF58 domain-containing protein [Virgisporangium aurantiacum]GIJ52571.1 hypothetical protein Vau01_000870 [Virgisporangium aurantiacum]